MKTKLPEGWKEVKLGDILDYEQPTKYIVKSTKYDDNFKTPVLTAGKSFLKGYTNETEGIREDLPVIIFDDFTTASQFVTFPFKVKSSAMKILTTKRKDVSLKFIFYLMQTIKFDSKTHKRYYLSKYQNLNIALPPIETQEAIVSLLEKAEKAKELRNEADELSKDYLDSVFNKIFGDLVKNTKNFESYNFKEVVDFQEGPGIMAIDFKKEGVPLIRLRNIKESKVNLTDCNFLSEDKVKIKWEHFKTRDKDILISTSASMGEISEITKETSGSIPYTGIIRLRPRQNNLNRVYLKFFIRSNYYVGQINGLKTGGTIKHYGPTHLNKVKIVIPPIELQDKFAEIVKQVEAMKEHQKESKEQIDNLFNALMQKAFKGELKC
jgi:type I restriction enzyme, S subunit